MKYRKKPVEVGALPWTNGCEIPDWAKTSLTEHEEFAHSDTLKGVMTATPGDFIIRGVEGEVYSCKTDDEELIENAPSDYYRGCGRTGTGKNKLGLILMEVRANLRSRRERDVIDE